MRSLSDDLNGGTPTPSRVRRVAWSLLAVVALTLSAPVNAAQPVPQGTSSSSARRAAIKNLPLDRLDESDRQRVIDVLKHTSVYRRLPNQVMRCDPELFQFMIENPEVLANIWQLLGIEDIVLERTSPTTFRADDGEGTRGDVEVLYRNHDTCLVYAGGSYDGPLFSQPITGNSVLLMRTAYSREPDGHYYITTRLDVFVQLHHVGLDFLAKTFQPLVSRVADYNFVATCGFIETLSQTAEINGAGLARLATRLETVDPQVRDQFILVTERVAQRARQRNGVARVEPPVRRAGYQQGRRER
ncbi:MAG: hypothetical protein K2Y37_16620 [Pirellulales bacterium]|nr:hypothetical protein [Pirellulales bacterium]